MQILQFMLRLSRSIQIMLRAKSHWNSKLLHICNYCNHMLCNVYICLCPCLTLPKATSPRPKPTTSGISNSNWSEGHILEIKCFAGHSLQEKSSCGPQYTRKSHQNKLNLIKFYTLDIYWGVRGTHKCIWRATCGLRAMCLRPLLYM